MHSSVRLTLATLTTFLCLGSIFCWSALDAGFRSTVWIAKVNLRLERIVCADPALDEALGISRQMVAMANEWDRLGCRVAVLYALLLIAAVATGLLLYEGLRVVSSGRILLLVCVAASWTALFATRSAVDQWALNRQVRSVLPQFEAAATVLARSWPTESQSIPPGISFLVSPKTHPNVLIVRGCEPYPVQEGFGYLIQRSSNEVIRFSLKGAHDGMVEYHPEGTRPAPYRSAFGYPSPPVATID
jgi:hypothetical protein